MKCQNCGTEVHEQAKFCPKCGHKIEQHIKEEIPSNVNALYDISSVWPEWKFEKQLGKGSYGVVYQAVRNDNNVESHAAIKIISIPADSSEVDSLRSEGLDMDGTRTYFKGIVDDFVSEIQLMESLKGVQNIVSVEDYKVIEKTEEIGWNIYIRMELLTPFNTYLCDKTLTEDEVIKIGIDICTALEICGQRNIIHRDIKPENIFVNDFGYFKLGDFGIARKLENMTGGLSQKGTFNYMAPEVANSNAYDARIDTYSLGIVLYRLLNNNKLPFLETEKQLLNPNERKQAVERRIHGEELPAPCNASPAMANLILRACAYNPDARFDSAAEMKQALISVNNGTYVVIDAEVDKTTAVRSANVACDVTESVRKPMEEKQKKHPVVDNFGEKPKKKGKKAKIIIVSILSAILALAIALAILFFTGAPYSIYKDMNNQDYDSATSQYRRKVKNSSLNEFILGMLLNGNVDKAVEKYNSGEWDYYALKENLDALAKMDIDGASNKLEEITESYANAIVAEFKEGKKTYAKAKKELNALGEDYEDLPSKIVELNEAYIKKIVENYKKGEIEYNKAKEELTSLADAGYKNAKTELDKLTESYAADIVIQFKNGKLNYIDATTLINELKADGYENADERLAEIDAIDKANKALGKGNEYYENGDYKHAIEELSKIPESSDVYEAAQNKLKQAYNAYIDSTVEMIELYANTQKQYKKAIQYADASYAILPDGVDTSKIDAAKEKAVEGYKTEISNNVTKLIAESNYTEALNCIDEAISFYDDEYFHTLKTSTENDYIAKITTTVNNFEASGDYLSAINTIKTADAIVKNNADFIEKLNKLEGLYKNQIISNADSALSSSGYKEAIRIIDEGLTVLPEDKDLLAKVTEYEAYKPVHLSKLIATNGKGYLFADTAKDPRNGIYTDVLYMNSSAKNLVYSGGQIEVFTNKQYSSFKCKIVPEAGFTTANNSGSMIKIYGDDVLLFTSDLITYKTMGVDVNIDITGVEYLEIKIENISTKSYSVYADTLLCDPYVSK